MNRRRFLAITAASLMPHGARASVWRGTALGADVSITLQGQGADAALADVRQLLRGIEGLFSLYKPSSALCRLNANGRAMTPAPAFLRLMAICGDIVRRTNGCFDPTVQPLWQALATGGDIIAARNLIGWDRVAITADVIRLAEGQALTFNGIAQGFATDLVTERLATFGFTRALVNIGEYRALGGPWSLSIDDPRFGALAQLSLDGNAVATSSPAAIMVGGHPHILSRGGQPPLWSTVSVAAPSAALADGLSTAFCLMDRDAIKRVLTGTDGVALRLIDHSGNLTTL